MSDAIPQEALSRRLTILGSTGSVGKATLDVVRFARERYGRHVFPLEALTAQSSVQLLAEQARGFGAKLAVIGDPSLLPALREALSGSGIEAACGEAGLVAASSRPAEIVMAAIVGAAGLAPTLRAAERGATIALANKECIVAAGPVFARAMEKSGSVITPVDSEHNGVFQLFDRREAHAIDKVTLTASGGPFRTWTTERMASATPEQAVSHPNWNMGAKISIDSATLMNKGLELIEAAFLFDLPSEKLDVVIHAQSLVHCLVAYADGSVLAHLSAPDMRTPIAHALSWPHRISGPARRLELAQLGSLTFETPDAARFPALSLARECLRIGGAAPTILNAANEVAVGEFLARRIGFLNIARVVEKTLDVLARECKGQAPASLEDVLALDALTRVRAGEICGAAAA